MKFLTLVLLASLMPVSSAYAASVTIEIQDEVSYGSIRTYNDGLTFVGQPKLYGMWLSASSIGESQDNAKVFCSKLSMSFYDQKTVSLPMPEEVVKFVIGTDGQVDGPTFNRSSVALGRVICKR